jgi:hypothetical protein
MSDIASKSSAQKAVSIKARHEEVLPDFAASGGRPRIGVLVNPFSGGNRNGLGAVRETIATALSRQRSPLCFITNPLRNCRC